MTTIMTTKLTASIAFTGINTLTLVLAIVAILVAIDFKSAITCDCANYADDDGGYVDDDCEECDRGKDDKFNAILQLHNNALSLTSILVLCSCLFLSLAGVLFIVGLPWGSTHKPLLSAASAPPTRTLRLGVFVGALLFSSYFLVAEAAVFLLIGSERNFIEEEEDRNDGDDDAQQAQQQEKGTDGKTFAMAVILILLSASYAMFSMFLLANAKEITAAAADGGAVDGDDDYVPPTMPVANVAKETEMGAVIA